MTRICKNIITSIALLLTLLPATMIAGNTTVTAKIDSVAILMGKQTRLHYQIVQDKGVEGTFVSDNPQLAGPNVEIIGEPHNDTTDLGNNRIQIDRTLIVQSFDSGIWEIRTDEINVIRIDPNIQSKAGFMFTVTRQGNITICKVFTIFL